MVADSAFRLSPTVLKCFDVDHPKPQQHSVNYAVIRTRREVDQAFGSLKGRWKVGCVSQLNDPIFAAKVATVCCGLHNIWNDTTVRMKMMCCLIH